MSERKNGKVAAMPATRIERSGLADKRFKGPVVNIVTQNRVNHWTPTEYLLNDDVNVVHGTHQIAFGFGATHGRLAQGNHWAAPGNMNFNGSVTGIGMGDFLLGRVNTLFQGQTNSHEIQQSFINLYGRISDSKAQW